MRGKSLALLSLALGCGLVASIGITQVMSRRNADSAAPAGDTQTVFVALQEINPGTPLTSQVLRLEQWPKDKVPAGALAKIEDIEGRRTRAPLYEGEPILDNKLFSKGTTGGGATSMIPKGYRVVPVKVDSVSGGSSMIQPGDRVDVMIYVDANSRTGLTRSSIRTVLQDVKVFAVNAVFAYDSSDSATKSISAKTISLLVTPNQATKLMLATELGKVRLVMRSPEDDATADPQNVSSVDLFGNPEAAGSATGPSKGGNFLNYLQRAATGAAAQQAVSPVAASAARAQHTLRILSGPDVSDVLFEKTDEPSGSASPYGKWKVSSQGDVPSFGRPGGRASERRTPPPEPPQQEEQKKRQKTPPEEEEDS